MTNLEDNNFSENVLHKIKAENISPKPKWRFLLKNSVVWGLGIFSLVLGAISISLVFYMLTSEDTGFGRAGDSLEALFFVIPFFWIVCLAVFAFSVYYYIKHTKKGYKYSAKLIIALIFVASLFLGGLLNLLGASRLIDDVLGERAPLYDRVINPQLNYWSNPTRGRLTGLVVSQADRAAYYLVDRSGDTWVVLLADENDSRQVIVGRPVRLIGRVIGDNGFVAQEILSVGPGRGFFKRELPVREMETCGLNPDGQLRPCNIPPPPLR